MTHDCKRHGTTMLFAALSAATWELPTDCRSRGRNQEFLAFLKLAELHTSHDPDVRLVIDDDGTRKHDNATKWLEHSSRKGRWHVHLTPISALWPNRVERWFRELSDKRLRRDSFTRVGSYW